MRLTDDFEAKPAIYIFTNLINDKVYVGETMDMRSRTKGHLCGKK
jgi:predicted GIY-YIG superfamily endonuclease